jgi:hypothetical protein
MAAVASMSAALAVTHQLRRGTGGGDYAVCSGLRRCPGLRQCGDNTDGGSGGGDIVGGGTGGPIQPHVQPSLRDGGMWSRLQVPVPYTRTDHPTRSCSRSELSYNVIPIPRPVMPLQPWVSGAANEAYEIPVHVETRGHEFEAARLSRIRLAANPRFTPTQDARSSRCGVQLYR